MKRLLQQISFCKRHVHSWKEHPHGIHSQFDTSTQRFQLSLTPDATSHLILGWTKNIENMTPDSVEINPKFQDFLFNTLKHCIHLDPSTQFNARFQKVGYLTIPDLRVSLLSGRTPNSEDILGTVLLDDGEIVPRTFEPMPTYRIFSMNGFIVLSDFLYSQLLKKFHSFLALLTIGVIMSRHSKNNTSRGFFTYQEKQKLNYGTIRQRMGKDSMRPFDACFLCLQTARHPVSCLQGHLACKECMYEMILAQKKEIQRLTQLYEHEQSLKNLQSKELDNSLKLEKVKEFELTQTSVLIDAKKDLHAQTSMKSKTLPSFWIPSQQPEAASSALQKPCQDVQCHASSESHAISLKKLVEIHFKYSENGTMGQIICPLCNKTFTNGSKVHVLKNCGHAFCSICIKDFIKKSKTCLVCDEKCKERDMIELASEGTGFTAGGGHVQVEKVTEAFQ